LKWRRVVYKNDLELLVSIRTEYSWTEGRPCIIELMITDNKRKYTFGRCTVVVFARREVLFWVLAVLTGGHIGNLELKYRD
jgi:hypothetical protein